MASRSMDGGMDLDIRMLFSSGRYISSPKGFTFLPPFPTFGDGSVFFKGLAPSRAFSRLISSIYAHRSSDTIANM